jgi:hypothetical protein
VRFLAPAFLAGAALIALPIILHLLRRDVAPRVPFTAVRLLRAAPVDRTRSRRLRDVILLAARVTALLLLAAAFARPYRASVRGNTPLTLIAVDRSFSMGAPGTFERARALAQTEIDRAAGARVAVIAFDDRPDVVAGPGLAGDARAALAKLTPGAGATRYTALLERAAELAGGETAARLVVISDLQRSGFTDSPASLPKDIDLQIRDAGGARANLAIDDLDVRDGRVRVAVHNYGEASATTTLRVGAPSAPGVGRPIQLGAGASVSIALDAPVVIGPIEASITDPAGYPADNERFAVAGPRALPQILVLSGADGAGDGFYLTRALLAGDDRGAIFDVKVLTGQQFSALPPGDIAQAAAVVLLSTEGIHRRAAASFTALFNAGGGAFVAAGPDTDPAVLSRLFALEPGLTAGEDSRPGVLGVSDLRHPVFRPFNGLSANLGQIAFTREWRIGGDQLWRPVAHFSTGAPALVERSVGNGRVLLFASDVDRRWNDFPLHAMFVPFVQEAVRYVAARRPAAGSIPVADVPADVSATPGIVSISGRARPVNVDARESAVERMTPAEFTGAVTRSGAADRRSDRRRGQEREASQGLWRYGLALMLVTLVAEAFVGAR